MHALSGAVPARFSPSLFANAPHVAIPYRTRGKYRRKSRALAASCSTSRMRNGCLRDYGFRNINNRLLSLKCKCQRAESTSGDAKKTWFTEPASKADQILGELNGQKDVDFENGSVIMPNDVSVNQSSDKTIGNPVEDEVWRLLQESVVYYCGTPVGTIAAKDPSDSGSSVLNYDQVFIRDFIPSGMAFLLMGEYEIVRNFILHTLQLQVMH